jgi:hypothetical protein
VQQQRQQEECSPSSSVARSSVASHDHARHGQPASRDVRPAPQPASADVAGATAMCAAPGCSEVQGLRRCSG